MSAQLIELLIFAAIAFFIISKLISTIGTTSEDDPAKKKKIFFGETGIKDVTPEGNTKVKIYRPAFKNKQLDQSLKALIVPEHKEDISKGLSEVMERMPSFNIEKFLRGAKVAFKMILNYGKDNNEAEIEKLVDKRYIDHFTAMIPSYGNYKECSSKNLTGKIS